MKNLGQRNKLLTTELKIMATWGYLQIADHVMNPNPRVKHEKARGVSHNNFHSVNPGRSSSLVISCQFSRSPPSPLVRLSVHQIFMSN